MVATLTDILIITLLAGSIGYGWYVSRKVQILMAALKDMEPLVQQFSMAVDKSEESVNQLKLNLNEPPQPAPAVEEDEEDEPVFSTRRYPAQKIPGVQVVRNKQDLVRRFFETSRTETRA
ncbi:flagellar motor switch protein [Cognatishimia sp. SS12]|uniref:flagellar motor switch protein n=1 Tax=Cognatishimia sp. SS12 TaxID=2979465 RepID=UPI00232B68D8|nr:flagellar motor switch protein [Cognatishimia sp. SS12]MDC0739415.1 flagellar motor switch protein [Cognatishimia sp. SS12]